MEEQIPSSSIPPVSPALGNQPIPGTITSEMLAQMKQQAMELAISQQLQQQQQKGAYQGEDLNVPASSQIQQPKVVYVRRNLTVAELIVILFVSIGIVTGVQFGWKVVVNNLPSVEIRVK